MMSLERYFIFSSYAMFMTGYVMLASTRQLDVFSLGVFAVVLGAGWLIDTERLSWSLEHRSANWLMTGGLAFLITEWYALGVSPVTVTLHFVFFAAALKVSTTFLLLVIIYLFSFSSPKTAYEMRRSASAFAANNPSRRVTVEFRKGNDRRPVESPRLGSLPVFSACALAAILLLAAPIFLAMPRVSRGFSRSGMLRGEALTGFSDSVRLGEVAQIKLNPQVVMRVRVKSLRGTEPRALRWRGVTLDNYDGQTWNCTGKPAPLKRGVDGFHLGEFGGYKQALQSQTSKSGVDGFHPGDAEWGYGDTEQRFFLEPLAIDTVFVAPEPRLITGLPDLARDQGDGLWTAPHDYYKLDYTAFSDTSEVSDERLAAENSRAYPSEIQRRYLQLPDNHDRRIDELAAEVTRGATTNVEIARRIEKYLSAAYGYTLDLRRVEDGDPVADFLFNTRQGHCEYFASAMVLMLRSRRVPARLVNGFQTGEYNEAADVYTVRQSDAHSWVEVYFPGEGHNGVWVAFDPTPPTGRSVYGGGLAAWLRHRREAMEMFWLEHVVGFDANKQFSMAGAAQRWVSSLFSSYKWDLSSQWIDWVSKMARQIESRKDPGHASGGGQPESPPSGAGPRTPALALSVAALALAAAFSWRRYGRSWRRSARHDCAASAVAFYQEMLRALEHAGHKRALHQTPAEYAEQLRAPAVSEITAIYQQVRFGDRILSDDDIARVSLLLREVRRGLRIENRG